MPYGSAFPCLLFVIRSWLCLVYTIFASLFDMFCSNLYSSFGFTCVSAFTTHSGCMQRGGNVHGNFRYLIR
jgi:hypothetical protein